MKTFMANAETIQRDWWVVDAAGNSVGRLAVAVAILLRGKHKPTFTPHCDTGDHVIVINADQVVLTGSKDEERVYRHSGYPGGLKSVTKGELLKGRPIRLVEKTIKGMLPHNRLGAQIYRKLRVYEGASHPHHGQNPQAREV